MDVIRILNKRRERGQKERRKRSAREEIEDRNKNTYKDTGKNNTSIGFTSSFALLASAAKERSASCFLADSSNRLSASAMA